MASIHVPFWEVFPKQVLKRRLQDAALQPLATLKLPPSTPMYKG
jgi:hypothetical protein